MKYWLMKSEPKEFSIDDLRRKEREPWSGVRNYQARNFMRNDMHLGDKIFFYHSNCEQPGIVGIAKVASKAYPDPTQFDPQSKYFDPLSKLDNPRWMLVDIAYEQTLKRVVTLSELKDKTELSDFALIKRGNRLSVMPVTATQWKFILRNL